MIAEITAGGIVLKFLTSTTAVEYSCALILGSNSKTTVMFL
jgi:hypothetical protein